MRDVLIINSFAGSLTIAAHSLGARIRGSYEDAGFGIKIQKANFPDLNYIDHCPWPKQDLGRTTLIARPPCSAFSGQMISVAKVHEYDEASVCGTSAEAFKCTTRILKYGMENNAENIAIESVMGAMDGARQVHDRYAKRYGYNVFRILQNAATFGVPQWRERFWCIFSRRPKVYMAHQPNVLVAKRVFKNDDGCVVVNLLDKQHSLLRAMGMTSARIKKLFDGDLGYGRIDKLVGIGDDAKAKARFMIGGGFSTVIPRVIDPDGFCPTLLKVSTWVWRGKMMSDENYKRAMGFPAGYVMSAGQTKIMLSKGACPPVARWVLDKLRVVSSTAHPHTIVHDGLLDLRVKKSRPSEYRFTNS